MSGLFDLTYPSPLFFFRIRSSSSCIHQSTLEISPAHSTQVDYLCPSRPLEPISTRLVTSGKGILLVACLYTHQRPPSARLVICNLRLYATSSVVMPLVLFLHPSSPRSPSDRCSPALHPVVCIYILHHRSLALVLSAFPLSLVSCRPLVPLSRLPRT
jgi:hypothetical protein